MEGKRGAVHFLDELLALTAQIGAATSTWNVHTFAELRYFLLAFRSGAMLSAFEFFEIYYRYDYRWLLWPALARSV